jgi:2-oxoglutarate dehydrogenase complex dehydrogenase (E1) component-like enzyme
MVDVTSARRLNLSELTEGDSIILQNDSYFKSDNESDMQSTVRPSSKSPTEHSEVTNGIQTSVHVTRLNTFRKALEKTIEEISIHETASETPKKSQKILADSKRYLWGWLTFESYIQSSSSAFNVNGSPKRPSSQTSHLPGEQTNDIADFIPQSILMESQEDESSLDPPAVYREVRNVLTVEEFHEFIQSKFPATSQCLLFRLTCFCSHRRAHIKRLCPWHNDIASTKAAY